jgi:hypothetical protein
MHRAVVLTTLVVLLLAVAGVSAAQESGIFLGGPSSDALPGSCAEALRALSDEDLDALEIGGVARFSGSDSGPIEPGLCTILYANFRELQLSGHFGE